MLYQYQVVFRMNVLTETHRTITDRTKTVVEAEEDA